ncbi:MAG: guanylate kinase [Actinobacteria bacterium]|nr:guanylate kinase [Actinomycetota bacterium]
MAKKLKGTLFVISGPSGAGKSTLIRKALSILDNFVKSVSVTTRPQRKGEKNGSHYHFVSKDEFEKMIKDNQLLEWAQYCGYYYGTPKKFVDNNLQKGMNIILEIEVSGALQVRKAMPQSYLIFISAPGVYELEKRLKKRARECESEISDRMKKAKEEIKYEKYYDCIIINNNYNEALKNLLYVLTSKCGGN